MKMFIAGFCMIAARIPGTQGDNKFIVIMCAPNGTFELEIYSNGPITSAVAIETINMSSSK